MRLRGQIETYLSDRRKIFPEVVECYGRYEGEDIGEGGITRRPEHWQIDIKATR